MTEWILSSVVLMLMVLALRGLLKGRISPGLRYALWLLVLLRLLLPFQISRSVLSVSANLPEAVTGITAYRAPVMDYDQAYAQVAEEYAGRGVDPEKLTGSARDTLERKVQEKMVTEYSLGQVLAVLWLAGSAVTAAWLLAVNLRFARRLGRSRRAVPVSGCPVPVYVSGAVEGPCLFGVWKPAIYLPADAPWDERAMDHIQAHEQTHYRHGDHIWSALRCVCLAIHWYDPLVWVCAALSRRDGELACDAAAIRALGEERRAEYGRTLIAMTCRHAAPGLAATTMNDSPGTLRERIALIARQPRTAAITMAAVLLAAVLAVGCTFTGSPAVTETPTEPATEAVTAPVTEPITQPPTERPTEPPTEASTQPDALLLEFQHLLSWHSGTDHFRAAGCLFDAPEEIDLYFFFYGGVDVPGEWEDMGEQERQLLLAQGIFPELDIQKLPGTRLEEELRRYFGLGLGDVTIPPQWASDPETETWYSNHSDAWIPRVEVTGYELADGGTVRLHLIVDAVAVSHDDIEFNVATVMTLRPMEDGSYQILSNVPA